MVASSSAVAHVVECSIQFLLIHQSIVESTSPN
ncbi:hypothetical protein CLAFUW4_06497 [Fulvia fulva]|nr:uncharacterized protein CLAFUR5_20217 [Fulvia fulva]KAK4621355.1 hypothetical protein CLAFUR4_06504 [Fulvia fulva]KAK4622682.1 hypothetical protein CLAFUR0_06502 [Fulvia fulva]WMI38914.1 hypothetical protein CLAFUR5_20217 [Fulvia fulva]WPV16257.1 hypothetical protein CLAFUW4_06497 [Fulvia fulva]WPV31087.1 hypothetical protein CLAFUW7_06497 [Fulvia fulva]